MTQTTPPPGASADALEAVPPTILIVDDEKNIRRTLHIVLAGEGHNVIEAESAEDAVTILARPDTPVDLAVIDVNLPGISGLALLAGLRKDEATRELPVIVISGHATVHDAVQAIKLGASDFFEKPLNRERVVVSVHNVIRTARLARTVEDMRQQIQSRYEMIGASAVMQRMYKEIDRVAPTKASVLITGESGTGKELVSRALHRLSPRADSPFVKVNCAAIPRELIESELFGHERGSFTGAQARKRGLFEQAHGGTLFLDEIGDMDLAAQAKVLRALQSGEVSRVGSEHLLHVDVRVLAATNKSVDREVSSGRFREDLYFRLNVIPIRCPALRERIEDIRPLCDAFVEQFCRENGLRSKTVDSTVFDALVRRSWPGNVRELKNVIERAVILSGDTITVADLPEDPHANPFDDEVAGPDDLSDAEANPSPNDSVFGADRSASPHDSGVMRVTLREFREQSERRYIVDTLRELDWNISRTATCLGVERTNLHKKIRAYGIKRGE